MDLNYDIVRYFDDKEIDYDLGGSKNVTRDWISIECPFPNCDDPSSHCGVSPQKLFYCWRCGSKGNVIKLVSQIENISYKEAKKLLDIGYQDDSTYIESNEIHAEKVKLPGTSIFPDAYTKYLQNRDFRIPEVINKYDLRASSNVGDWKFRIVIPIYINNKLVSYTTRSIFNKTPKYKNCPNEKAVMPVRQCVYNIDTVVDSALIVEGPFDVFRLGDKSVSLFGMEFSKDQVNLIREKKLKRAFILFDTGENESKKAKSLAMILNLFIQEVKILQLESGDPADLTYEEAFKLKMEIKI